MKMNKFQNVEASRGAKLLDRGDEIRRVETELRLFAATLLPPSKAARRQLDAHTSCRRDLHLLRHLQQDVDLTQLLQHDENLVPKLLTHEGQPHELLVFVAVADDEVISRLGETENRLQLRLAAALESDTVRLAEF